MHYLNVFKQVFLVTFLLVQPVLAEEESQWDKIKSGAADLTTKSLDIGSQLLDQSRQGVGGAAAYISQKYSTTKSGMSSWSVEKYNSFASEYPEIASNIEAFAGKATQTSEYIYEKSVDGVVTAYQVSASGVKTAVEWTDSKIDELPEITACGIAELDTLGGVAIGTVGTALVAGSSTTTATATTVMVAPSMFGWVPVAATTATSIVSTPAVAVGVTATAIAGATVYATSKGLCYLQNKDEGINTADTQTE